MNTTSRQLAPRNPNSRIAEAFQSATRLDRAKALHSALDELVIALDHESKLHVSLRRRANDIEERACLREYGSPLDAWAEDDSNLFYAMSDFERAAAENLRRESGEHFRTQQRLDRRVRRVRSLLKTMNMRRVA